MIKHFFIAFIFIIITKGIYAQSDCNCANSAVAKKYKQLAGGSNSQVCSQCAYMALYTCLCTCETTNMTPQQLEQAIKQIGQTLKDLRTQGIGQCCSEYEGLTKNCPNAGKNKGNSNSGNTQTSESQKPTSADFNKGFVDVVNLLTTNSSDPETKKFAENANNVHKGFAEIKAKGAESGVSNEAIKVADGIETAVHLYNLFFGRKFNEPDPAIERAKQLEHDSARTLLRTWHGNLQELRKKNANDSVTAKYRLSLLRCNKYEEKNTYMTRLGLYSIAKKTETESSEKGTPYILKEIDDYFKKNTDKGHLNEYLGNSAEEAYNHRKKNEAENLELFVIPQTFNPEKDKLLKVTLKGKGKITSFMIYSLPKYNLIYEYNTWDKKGKLGWDGRFNNEPQPAGSYQYMLTITDDKGEGVGKMGTFNLIRE